MLLRLVWRKSKCFAVSYLHQQLMPHVSTLETQKKSSCQLNFAKRAKLFFPKNLKVFVLFFQDFSGLAPSSSTVCFEISSFCTSEDDGSSSFQTQLRTNKAEEQTENFSVFPGWWLLTVCLYVACVGPLSLWIFIPSLLFHSLASSLLYQPSIYILYICVCVLTVAVNKSMSGTWVSL